MLTLVLPEMQQKLLLKLLLLLPVLAVVSRQPYLLPEMQLALHLLLREHL